MTESERYTAYCGLFCRDCIPSNTTFFETVCSLQGQLTDLGFEHYAALKAKRIAAFRDYTVFTRVLEAMAELPCAAPCREGGGNPRCEVRRCAIRKSLTGCWECADFRECELLQPLRNFHGNNINHNLEMIARYGPAEWSERCGKHYPWQEERNQHED